MRALARALVLLLVIAGCDGGGSPILALPFVTFSSERDGNEEIYRCDSNGNFPLRLTNDASQDHQPAFSQDNSKIIFSSMRNGNDDVFSMNADGSGLVQLTNDPLGDNCPRYNFSGTQIVFQRGAGTAREIWKMDADGTNEVQVTSDAFNDNEPSWTPDGRIIFTSRRSGNKQLWLMNADGTNIVALTTNPLVECYQADYSADGANIAFVLEDGTGSYAFRMPAAGGAQVDISNGNGEAWPRWSADGTRLVVTAVVGGNEDVYRIMPDGSGFTRITFTAFLDGHGDW